ncbi:hypothetical protein M427DRAFT_249504 [Gonapodya prolifera JEL478]|uniref:RGS domain-containing protein n=1 Tax=Gonapodya prolifera (strain JEL478) TaxID=1344416 RepID=A0A138ZYK1_GONPJ|nr:hypothetical protein M427DRAFT_249504 [Gonapodya prolifera JEL478]|eukprot:KXS09193.1 hypothetical protein M427DRAFT_249504 [Gonapodya prolifera JEL478]
MQVILPAVTAWRIGENQRAATRNRPRLDSPRRLPNPHMHHPENRHQATRSTTTFHDVPFHRLTKSNPGDPLWEFFRSFAARDLCAELVLFIEAHDEALADAVANLRQTTSTTSDASSSAGLAGAATAAADADARTRSCPLPALTSLCSSRMSAATATATSTTLPKDVAAHRVPLASMPLFQAINERFVQPGGEMQLNLTFVIASAAGAAVRSGEYTIGVFDAVRLEVLRILSENTYPKFARAMALKEASGAAPKSPEKSSAAARDGPVIKQSTQYRFSSRSSTRDSRGKG